MSPTPDAANPPPPPWYLEGSAIVMAQSWRSLLALVHYKSSPVGPYNELAISTISWQGPTVTEMWVTSAESMRGGRENWGFPKQLRLLQWLHRLNHVTFQAGVRQWRVRLWGPAFPVRGSFWAVQRLHGQSVRVPFQMQGRAKIAWHGRQIALFIEHFQLTVLASERIR